MKNLKQFDPGIGMSGGGGMDMSGATDLLSSIGKGAAGGAAGGPAGAIGGAALGLGAGVVQLMKAQKLKQDASASMPQSYDPQQLAFLAELSQKRKAMETGAEFSGGMNAIDASTAGTNQAIVQAGGGDVGGTIQGLLQTLRVGQDSKNKVLANGQNQQLQYNSMFGGLLNDISGRKLQLQLLKHAQAQSDYAQMQKQGFQNSMAGAGHLGGGGDNSGIGGQGSGGAGFNPMDILKRITGGGSAPGSAPSAGGDMGAGLDALGGGGAGEAAAGGIMGGGAGLSMLGL